ncbi:S-layer homology domain-containing protein, partial [Paenibacillus sepulcri]|nr:S-layer homology domain-containing protein [Paenibacillus sepulcri]
ANGVGNDGASGAVFGDEGEISSWASEYVRNAAALQLIQDRSAGLFDPQGIATRAESAQIIYNLLNS